MSFLTRQGMAALLLVFLATGLCAAAEVSQGKCLQYDQLNKRIVIEAYDIQFSDQFPYGQPTGQQETFDVSEAMMGMTPAPGDILRFAYVIRKEEKIALKVMNVSRQDLEKK